MHVMLMFKWILKAIGCACGGTEFISLRIPSSGGLYAHVMSTVSQK
jgi:hypothetical protein